jgi:hypothetical protein
VKGDRGERFPTEVFPVLDPAEWIG